MAEDTNAIHLLGIRHHGPGSARSVVRALAHIHPDAILVEGPPDGDALLPLAASAGMEPPVALLIYTEDAERNAVYYPFARFSPEWQAIQYALGNGVPVSFMDLPHTHRFALDRESHEDDIEPDEAWRRDPIGHLADAAGHGDGERWWEEMVEERDEGLPVFAAIREAMTALREEEDPSGLDRRERLREAWMRKSIRAAVKAGHQNIAVVCGAWHVPALASMPPQKEDNALLKGLPKIKVEATWTPWTYGRLTRASGYGAGIEAPGWYAHLWDHGDNRARTGLSVRWLTRVAMTLREEGLDASSAHVIEAVRLADSLAAVRGRPITGLPELDDATRAVFGLGEEAPVALVRRALYIDDRLGQIPEDAPTVPLVRDLEAQQKRLRLKPSPLDKLLDLDLRKENDRERSCLLHRLVLLGVPWGDLGAASGRTRGTFHEVWTIQWKPEFAVTLIGAAVWGNTVAEAAARFVEAEVARLESLPELAKLMHAALVAQLPDCIGTIESAIQARCAVAGDVSELMDTVPHLAAIMRYGDVRKTDTDAIETLLLAINVRICAGLVAACKSLNDEAAEAMLNRMLEVNQALKLVESAEELERWRTTLRFIVDASDIHGLLLGRCCRILLDDNVFSAEELGRRMQLALSMANDPADAAAWLDGCLRNSGMILVYDEILLSVVNAWLTGLSNSHFAELLPLLRRVFSTFTSPERLEIGQRIRAGKSEVKVRREAEVEIDTARAEQVLPLVCQLLGISAPQGRGKQ